MDDVAYREEEVFQVCLLERLREMQEVGFRQEIAIALWPCDTYLSVASQKRLMQSKELVQPTTMMPLIESLH